MHCRHADVEVWRSGGLRRVIDVATGKNGGLEVWRLDVGVTMCRHRALGL